MTLLRMSHAPTTPKQIIVAMVVGALLVIIASQRLATATRSGGERPVFVPITPCRLVDTRPAPDTVGPRTSPLGPGETFTVQGRSPSGNCTGTTVPADATGLTVNVTAVNATQQTNLRVFPAGAPLPTVSNLNPTPGAPPIPNAATTDLNGAGQFSIFNQNGQVHVVVDVAGYFVDHDHDDRYYTEPEIDTKLATKADAATTYTKTQIDTALSAKADTTDVYTKAEVDQRTDIIHGAVLSDGTIESGNGVVDVAKSSSFAGDYLVTVDRNITGCSVVASMSTLDGRLYVVQPPATGFSDQFFVDVRDFDSFAERDGGFSFIVQC